MPAFQKIDDIVFGLKTAQHLVQPVIFKNQDVLLAIQLESRFIKNKNRYVGFP
jgi:hypothetical protein